MRRAAGARWRRTASTLVLVAGAALLAVDLGLVDAVTRPDCRIKGNVTRGGDLIYHVPGGEFYGRTRVHTLRGERWFCTEAEAEAAGWRRSRR